LVQGLAILSTSKKKRCQIPSPHSPINTPKHMPLAFELGRSIPEVSFKLHPRQGNKTGHSDHLQDKKQISYKEQIQDTQWSVRLAYIKAWFLYFGKSTGCLDKTTFFHALESLFDWDEWVLAF
jgi:hypothetical protein